MAQAGLAPECLEPAIGILIGIASFACRLALLRRVERAFGLPPESYWLVPLRDLLSFAVFVASFFGGDVRWKGRRYRLVSGGTLVVAGSSPRP
jgi:ceramide glucosyltransferase